MGGMCVSTAPVRTNRNCTTYKSQLYHLQIAIVPPTNAICKYGCPGCYFGWVSNRSFHGKATRYCPLWWGALGEFAPLSIGPLKPCTIRGSWQKTKETTRLKSPIGGGGVGCGWVVVFTWYCLVTSPLAPHCFGAVVSTPRYLWSETLADSVYPPWVFELPSS